MLSLVTTVHLKRKSLAERLHLCKSEKIIKECHTTAFGQINLYKIYSYAKKPFFTPERLSRSLKERLYDRNAEIPKEYLVNAALLRLTERLKGDRGKTVFLSGDFLNSPLLGQLCRYSARVYIMSDTLPKAHEEIYKSYGTMPLCVSFPVAADYCPDIKEPFTLSLPKELKSICPKDFSPLLFAALIYKENSVMIT